MISSLEAAATADAANKLESDPDSSKFDAEDAFKLARTYSQINKLIEGMRNTGYNFHVFELKSEIINES